MLIKLTAIPDKDNWDNQIYINPRSIVKMQAYKTGEDAKTITQIHLLGGHMALVTESLDEVIMLIKSNIF